MGHGVVHLGLVDDAVAGLEVDAQVRVVAVGPERPALRHLAPGQPLGDDPHGVALGVASELPGEPGIAGQHQPDVAGARQHGPGTGVLLQVLLPAVVGFQGLGQEVVVGRVGGGARELERDALQARRPLAHRLARRKRRHRRVGLGLGVQLAEAVDPHEVVGVAELAAGGVGGVVGVEPQPLVGDRAPVGAAARVRPAPLAARLVDVGQEALDRLLDGMGAAERPDRARLAARVGRLVGAAAGAAAREGPARGVAPVGVEGEPLVRVQRVAAALHELVGRVHAAAGGVHEPGGLVGRRVEPLRPQRLGELEGQRHVLVGRHLAGERHDEAVLGARRGGGVRGVHERLGAHKHEVVAPQPVVGAVGVEHDHGAARDRPLAPAPALQVAGHVARAVLGRVALGLGHGRVLRGRLGRAAGLAHPGRELVPCHALVAPRLGPAALCRGDSIVLRQRPHSFL